MRIRLSEIPKEGRAYTFDRASGELDEVLEDLIKKNNYEVELFIKPIANAYEMRGKVKTKVTELCALCGWDIDVEIDKSVNEILMEVDESEHRKSQSVHGNHSIDYDSEGPALVPIKGESFDAGDFVRDIVGIAEPAYASCGDQDCEHLSEARAIQARLAEEFEKADLKVQPHPAFAALKNLTSST